MVFQRIGRIWRNAFKTYTSLRHCGLQSSEAIQDKDNSAVSCKLLPVRYILSAEPPCL